jgi:hypothetical protein
VWLSVWIRRLFRKEPWTGLLFGEGGGGVSGSAAGFRATGGKCVGGSGQCIVDLVAGWWVVDRDVATGTAPDWDWKSEVEIRT